MSLHAIVSIWRIFRFFYYFLLEKMYSFNAVHRIIAFGIDFSFLTNLGAVSLTFPWSYVKSGSHIYAMWKVMDGLRLPNLMGKVTSVFLWWNALLSCAQNLHKSFRMLVKRSPELYYMYTFYPVTTAVNASQ